jgi:flavin reductase (DIM6/NTAB) family NADH-FMN oxidoreductase RutF
VTERSAVAALRPLTVRIAQSGLAAAEKSALLHFHDRETDTRIGWLALQLRESWGPQDARMALYEVVSGSHLCAGRLRRLWDTMLYRYASRAVPAERRLMTAAATEHTMVFYSCPRPVYFVSVDDGLSSNLFPMDLVGPLEQDYFTLALRNTSPSVETIKRSRRLALGDVPGDAASVAYRLGDHHKRPVVDWDALGLAFTNSPTYGLRLPQMALRVREVDITDSRTVGSHTLFLGRICSQRTLNPGPQLFHTSGAYQLLRRRQGRAFAEAPVRGESGPVGKV